jgi:hypothetical protein
MTRHFSPRVPRESSGRALVIEPGRPLVANASRGLRQQLALGMEEILFAFIPVGVAALGIGMVWGAAHIERKRQERHAERFGEH